MPQPFCHSIDDAKQKHCPFKLGNSDDSRVGFYCDGPQCMAWRFVWTHITDHNGEPTMSSGDTHGFCGAAGQPSS